MSATFNFPKTDCRECDQQHVECTDFEKNGLIIAVVQTNDSEKRAAISNILLDIMQRDKCEKKMLRAELVKLRTRIGETREDTRTTPNTVSEKRKFDDAGMLLRLRTKIGEMREDASTTPNPVSEKRKFEDAGLQLAQLRDKLLEQKKKARIESPARRLVCSGCYEGKLRCGGGPSCGNCQKVGKACTYQACRDYHRKSGCVARHCTLFHDEDRAGYQIKNV